MIGRILWFAALTGIALVTTALQIDKQSERNGALAVIVPEPLRNFAQTQVTQNALSGKNAKAALAEAERLVRRRPVPAEYLTLLAAAQAKAGKAEQAALTVQIAGQRGWRDPAAQEAVLRLALSAGDKAEAGRRYTALFLNSQTPNAKLEELGRLVLEEPRGTAQQTMVSIIAGGARWHGAFLNRGPQVMPPAAFSAAVVDSLARGADFDCRDIAVSLTLLNGRDAEAAAGLRQALVARCPDLPA